MRHRILSAVAVAVLIAACGKDPVPVAPTPAPTGGPPRPATLSSLSITAPSTVPPGETVALKAVGTMNDGLTQDYTTRATWASFRRDVLTVSSSGVLTAQAAGESFVTAFSNDGAPREPTVRATVNVLVLETGTYRLIGRVSEDGAPLADARVAVTGGHGNGLTATTDYFGEYRLYGVANDIDIEVTKPDYVPVRQRVHVTQHDVAHFTLSPARSRVDVSGTYDLTITADPFCATFSPPIPDDTQRRQYLAAITQQGPVFNVTLSGAAFLIREGLGNGFSGRVAPSGITVELSDGYYYYAGEAVVEVLSGDRLLTIGGFGSLSQKGDTISGPFKGYIVLYSSTGRFEAKCSASNHQFVFTRRSRLSPEGQR